MVQLLHIIGSAEFPDVITDAAVTSGVRNERQSGVAIAIAVVVLVLTTMGSAVVVLTIGQRLFVVLRVGMPHVVDFRSSHTSILLSQIIDCDLSQGRVACYVTTERIIQNGYKFAVGGRSLRHHDNFILIILMLEGNCILIVNERMREVIGC